MGHGHAPYTAHQIKITFYQDPFKYVWMDKERFRDMVERLGGTYEAPRLTGYGTTSVMALERVTWARRPHGPRCAQYDADCPRPKSHSIRRDSVQNKCSYCSRSDPPTQWDRKRSGGRDQPR